jgi:predicted phosphodiesterase
MECDEVIHVGDAVGIGPHPAEVVSLLTDRGVRCVMGNHDEIAAFGLPKPLPPWMSEGEAEHQRWTHDQLTQAQLEAVRSWPYELSVRCGEATVVFIHYARTTDGAFDHVANPTADDLWRLHAGAAGDVVVFGHDHREYDLATGGRRFLNPGSVGCHDKAEARALILAPADAAPSVARVTAPYDDTDLLADYEERQVPERDFILRTFIRRP